ncbi:thermonuclease family protein [Mesobacillus foraminis]|uniref:thermonuclease family protein n=1 Tax=Mesobacillus foraminis TaxID=279826 RepID=UPI000EF484B6|nr:thermonuclease family protein [Mesobacillus foraminis]
MKACLAMIALLISVVFAGCTPAEEQSGNRQDVENTGVEETQQEQAWTGDEKSPYNQDLKGLKAEVLSVIDGDTLKVRLENGREERVRLTLIDTPETKHPKVGVQPFGKEASKFTTAQLNGKNILLEMDVQERDRYGRILAYVWTGDQLFNEILIERGLARVAEYPPNIKYVDRFRSIQKKAQAAEIGIWSLENYAQEDGYNTTEPWDRKDSESAEEAACKGKIKGNENSYIYHLPDGDYYDTVHANNIIWFCTEEEAKAGGFRASTR